MSENRRSEIVDEELDCPIEEVIDPKEIVRDEIFEKLKLALLEESRLLKRFIGFCQEYVDFEYDESACNMDDADLVLVRADKIRDLILNNLSNSSSYSFLDIQTNPHNNSISFFIKIEEFHFKIIIEVFQDSFDLEIV